MNHKLIDASCLQSPPSKNWENGVDALQHALKMESKVTDSIRNVIIQCESDPEFNDYHVSYSTVTCHSMS